LIGATLACSWLGMQAAHELGHVVGALVTGGDVARVVLHPLTFSRTDLATNPHPLVVAWAGPLVGALLPLAGWGVWRALGAPATCLPRFVAGFCLVANGTYLGVAPWKSVGDCVVLLQHGARLWQLVAFGVVAVPCGLLLWHGQGASFGLSAGQGRVSRTDVRIALVVGAFLLAIALAVDGR
jgi:hypothetical protein